MKCTLGLYNDNDGILRVKGRLEYSDWDYESKYPIYLDKGSYLTILFIIDVHLNVKHCGVKDTLNEIRSAFWVNQGIRTVHSVISLFSL